MKLKNLLKRRLAFIGVAGLVLSVLAIFSLGVQWFGFGTSDKLVSPEVFPGMVSFELPVRLTIPKIKVDARVEPVGLTAGGAMAVPKGPDEVAWFSLGSRPGEIGSAVVSGHYGWKNNIPAVFDDLHKLQPGDKIHVEDKKGTITTFVVRELRRYEEDANVPEVFTSYDGEAHLNLITCEGVWDKTDKSYSKRLVVFTDKEKDSEGLTAYKLIMAAIVLGSD